jgi:hypothetical protein
MAQVLTVTLGFAYDIFLIWESVCHPSVTAQYSAAHRRHGLASDTVGCGAQSRGFLINMCRGTARACGLGKALTIAARHISISNNADGVARTSIRCCFAGHGVNLCYE